MKFRRINLFAGPGVGKSTLSSQIFSELKSRHKDVELVTEYVKKWVYEGRKPDSFDQLYVTSKQIKTEETFLKATKVIVTDSPILLGVSYAKFYGCNYSEALLDISTKFDEKYPAFNVFLKREFPYNNSGRFQNYDEAICFDNYLLEFLKEPIGNSLHVLSIADAKELILNSFV